MGKSAVFLRDYMPSLLNADPIIAFFLVAKREMYQDRNSELMRRILYMDASNVFWQCDQSDRPFEAPRSAPKSMLITFPARPLASLQIYRNKTNVYVSAFDPSSFGVDGSHFPSRVFRVRASIWKNFVDYVLYWHFGIERYPHFMPYKDMFRTAVAKPGSLLRCIPSEKNNVPLLHFTQELEVRTHRVPPTRYRYARAWDGWDKWVQVRIEQRVGWMQVSDLKF